MFRGRMAALALAVFIAIPVAAGDENRDAERAHEARGKQLFRARHYAAAAAEFVEAYEAVEDAGLLFQMGQSYRLAGEKQNALAAYRSYLRRGPRGSTRAAVEKYIAELNRALGNPPEKPEKPEKNARAERTDKKSKRKRGGAPIAATVAPQGEPADTTPVPVEEPPPTPPATPPAAPPTTTPAKTPATTTTLSPAIATVKTPPATTAAPVTVASAKTPATGTATTPTVETPPAPPIVPETLPPVIIATPDPTPPKLPPPVEKPGRALVASGAVIAVAGVVVAVVGVLFGVKAMQLGDDLTHAKPGTVFDPDLDAIAKTDQTIAIALGATGGALAVAGAAIALLGWRRGRAAQVAIFPSLGRDDATLSLAVRF